MSMWSEVEKYERTGWKLGTLRGEHVRRRRLEKTLSFVEKGDLVLDIGVGPATLSQDFPCTVIGCDINLGMLLVARERIHGVVRCDAQHLPFADKVFDISFESTCLVQIPDKERALAEMIRVAKRTIVTFECNRCSLRRIFKRKQSTYLSFFTLRKMHKDMGLNPTMLMVGFAPFFTSKILFKLWKPFEDLIELLPFVKYLCGGVLVASNLKNIDQHRNN